jgi:hypothetical protein
MSVTTAKREMLVEKRARALAMMLLTRRPELHIEEENQDFGFDYIVRFRTPKKEGLREFAIEVKATSAAVTKDQADKAVRPALHQLNRHGPFLRPVCLFFFTMENDAAWYTWAAEPEISADGRALLRLHDKPDCRRLDEGSLGDILQRVDAWYDAVFPSVVVNGSGAEKADRKRTNR